MAVLRNALLGSTGWLLRLLFAASVIAGVVGVVIASRNRQQRHPAAAPRLARQDRTASSRLVTFRRSPPSSVQARMSSMRAP
jgi:hypothetical protein